MNGRKNKYFSEVDKIIKVYENLQTSRKCFIEIICLVFKQTV